MMGGEGEDQAGDEGLAKLGDGVAVLKKVDEGAINPSELPPWYALGGREWTKLAEKDGPILAMA